MLTGTTAASHPAPCFGGVWAGEGPFPGRRDVPLRPDAVSTPAEPQREALPIDPVLPAVREALRLHRSAVLEAPPGAGKTTRVPLALLGEPWLDEAGGDRLVMLEPRRLAARAAARRMAALLGEPVGATVGYRTRMDTRVGPRTRIEVVTEGVLTRMLRADPALEGVGLVIFDEFHERSVQVDLGLALCLQSRAVLRPELRVLVMSATLHGEGVAGLLGGAPVITSEGRSHPVEIRYRPRPLDVPLETAVASAVSRALASDPGDLLVFLPGAAEIRRVAARLEREGVGPGVAVLPLHGALPPEAQDRAIAPGPPGMRKVVLATSIAETSLTIEGVRVVIDAGLVRVPRFSSRSGMTRLETVRISRASAEQRRGRAGRLGPGICYRLWSEGEHAHLAPFATPEILEADLAPVALELAAVGIADPSGLAWLDRPPPDAFARARALLTELGALDASGRITAHGREMAELGMHPRLAHMVLTARRVGLGGLACELAALLGERDLLRGASGPPDPDLRLRVELLRARAMPDAGALGPGHQVDREMRRRVRAQAERWKRVLGLGGGEEPIDSCGLVLAFAYPDRIAQRRSEATGGPEPRGRYLLRNGTGAVLVGAPALGDAPYLAVAELDGRRPERRIALAAPITASELEAHFAGEITREEVVEWEGALEAVVARRRDRLGALVLREAPLPRPDAERVAAVLLDRIARAGLEVLPWSEAAKQLRQRVAFLRRLDPAWPDLSDEALVVSLPQWLGPHVRGVRRLEELAALDLAEILRERLGARERQLLETLAPTHLVVPSGSRIRIDYSDPDAPVLAVRLQEMFGLAETPRIAGGRVPLTLHLLSPAGRPVQVTRDLARFWRAGYFEVRRELRGRYPKHAWPEDPLGAAPARQGAPRRRSRPPG